MIYIETKDDQKRINIKSEVDRSGDLFINCGKCFSPIFINLHKSKTESCICDSCKTEYVIESYKIRAKCDLSEWRDIDLWLLEVMEN